MINLGFIGVGGYGNLHLQGFLPYHAKGRVRIRALADPSPIALSAAEQQPELSEADSYRDYRDMLGRDDLQAVVISAPIPAHREIALAAIRRGLFVLLEKPPVPLLSELRELITADSGRRVMVAFQHIYRPLIQRMKLSVQNGDIGRPEAVTAWGIWPRATEYYERSAWAGELFDNGRATLDGPCTNAMSHFLNSLFFIAGSGLSSYARPMRLEGETYRARPIASYDTCALRGNLETGLKFAASFSHAASEKAPARLVVSGSGGRMELFDDATYLRDARGDIFLGGDGREELREAFLGFAEGDAERNLTGLEAMEPYVLATNMMFQSSGGIHDLPEEAVEISHPGTPEEIYRIPGLAKLFERCAGDLCLLQAAGAAWAISPSSLSVHDFSERRMLNGLRSGEPVICTK